MRTIVAYRRDLLGTRLINFLSALQLARATGARLFLLWPDQTPFSAGSYDVFDIFDASRLTEENYGIRVIKSYDWSKVAAAAGVPLEQLLAAPDADKVLSEQAPWTLSTEVVWCRVSGPAQRLRQTPGTESLADLFRSLPLHPKIEQVMSAFDDAGLSDGVAVHMRRGDFINARVMSGDRVVGEGLFALSDLSDRPNVEKLIFNYIVKYVPTRTILRITETASRIALFSDVVEDRREVEAACGDRVIDVHGVLDRWPDLTPMQRAFCELILMSRCPQILATRSNFSGAASLMGGSTLIRMHKWMKAKDVFPDIRRHVAESRLSDEDKAILHRDMIRAYRDDFLRRGAPNEADVCTAELAKLDGASIESSVSSASPAPLQSCGPGKEQMDNVVAPEVPVPPGEAVLGRMAELEQQGRLAEALEIGVATLPGAPDPLPLARTCAGLATRLGRWDVVIDAGGQAIRLNPRKGGKAYIWFALAFLYGPAQAELPAWFEDLAAQYAPSEVCELLARFHLIAGDMARAQPWLRRHALQQPFADGGPFPNAIFDMLWTYIDALSAPGQADTARAQLLLARMLIEAGRTEEAAARLSSLAESEPLAQAAHLQVVLANEAGDPAAAKGFLQRAVELDPDSAQIRRSLAFTEELISSGGSDRKIFPKWSGPPLRLAVDPAPAKNLANWWFTRRLARAGRGEVVRAEIFRPGQTAPGWVHPVYCGSSLRLTPRSSGQPGQYFLFDLISPPVLDAVRRGEGSLLVDHGCEGLFWSNSRDDAAILLELLGYLKDQGLPASRVLILDGNLRSPQISKEVAAAAGLEAPPVLAGLHAWLEMTEIYREPVRETGGVDERLLAGRRTVQQGQLRPKHFLSFNAAPRPHRCALVALLLEKGLLDRGLVSFTGPSYRRRRGVPIEDERWLQKTVVEAGSLLNAPNEEELFRRLLEVSPLEVDVPFKGREDPLSSKSLGRDNNEAWPYLDTYLSLVTDTVFSDQQSILISEKLSRPIANLHLFVYFGEPGALAELRRRGYRTFSPAIDESYDEIADPSRRMAAAVAEAERLISMPLSDLHQLYCDLWPILLHNYRRFTDEEALSADALIADIQKLVC